MIPNPPLPWPLWGTLMTAALGGWAASVVMFCHHIAGWHRNASHRWVLRVVPTVLVALVAASWLSLSEDRPEWLTLWLGIEIVAFLLYAVGFLFATWRRPSSARVLISTAIAVTVVVGIRDWFVLRVGPTYGDAAYLRYASLFFGMALLGILVLRFRSASTQARELLGTLASRLVQREAELERTYQQLESVARTQARTQERERILADMHDGVGAHLSAAIRQLQSGRAQPDQLLSTLRDSLDQLKLSIDSLRLPPGDVGALLASLRYRLEPRFAALGLALEWAVDELPPIERFDEQAIAAAAIPAVRGDLERAAARARDRAAGGGRGAW